ncbi:MAG: hypothetical protein KDJ29_19960, partial [Hyphomicrobiales bacterium]|nr:hypothetical protein [Hyphomicrobiales bacterium]
MQGGQAGPRRQIQDHVNQVFRSALHIPQFKSLDHLAKAAAKRRIALGKFDQRRPENLEAHGFHDNIHDDLRDAVVRPDLGSALALEARDQRRHRQCHADVCDGKAQRGDDRRVERIEDLFR